LASVVRNAPVLSTTCTTIAAQRPTGSGLGVAVTRTCHALDTVAGEGLIARATGARSAWPPAIVAHARLAPIPAPNAPRI
jgi:hypothetical protein